MGNNNSPSAKQIGSSDLRGVNRDGSRLLRANVRSDRHDKVRPESRDHWTRKEVTVQAGEFALLLRPKRRLLPGLIAPYFWTMRCEEIRMVAMSGSVSTLIWSTANGTDIGTHRIWSDCRKSLPDIRKQLHGFQQSMMALADLERHHPTEATGVPYLFVPVAQLSGQRATSLVGSTRHTRHEIEREQIDLLDR